MQIGEHVQFLQDFLQKLHNKLKAFRFYVKKYTWSWCILLFYNKLYFWLKSEKDMMKRRQDKHHPYKSWKEVVSSSDLEIIKQMAIEVDFFTDLYLEFTRLKPGELKRWEKEDVQSSINTMMKNSMWLAKLPTALLSGRTFPMMESRTHGASGWFLRLCTVS